jgi:membrane-associated protease RseP (regulator of RpoE activity)
MWMGYRGIGIGPLAGWMLSGVLATVALGQPEAPARSSDTTPTPPPAAQAEAAPAMDWWLGVQCRPMNEALRRELGLAETGGVLVEKTVPESPAEKAGLHRHDVLTAAGGKPLQNARDLLDAVNASQGKALVVEYLRDGEKHHVTVQPQQRPDWARIASNAEQSAALRKWLEQLQSGEPGAPMRFRFIHPGTILPQGAPTHPPLPANVSITIIKRGSELAQVIVTRDDQKWEVAENELEKLPKDLIPYAELMLGRTVWGPVGGARLFEFVPDGAGPPRARGEETAPPASDDAKAESDRALEQRLEQMNQQIERLRGSIEELRNSQTR